MMPLECPTNMAYRLASIRSVLNVGIVVRLTQEEMGEVVNHLATFDLVPRNGNATAKDIIDAFKLERLALKWEAEAGGYQWLLVPYDTHIPQGELGGGAVVVALCWDWRGNAEFKPAGHYTPSSCFLHEMADECECRASSAAVTCEPCGLANFTESNQS